MVYAVVDARDVVVAECGLYVFLATLYLLSHVAAGLSGICQMLLSTSDKLKKVNHLLL